MPYTLFIAAITITAASVAAQDGPLSTRLGALAIFVLFGLATVLRTIRGAR